MTVNAPLSGVAVDRLTSIPASRGQYQTATCDRISTSRCERNLLFRERTSASLAAARAEGRIGGPRKKLDAGKRKEIADSVISGRKSGAETARLYNISAPTCRGVTPNQRR
jgi:DNA invertase Pin-like site-specific DNA recombinase